MTNFYLGLARGPIDHQSSSVINVISSDAITMGDAVELDVFPSIELLARVKPAAAAAQGTPVYGIAVGGDTDGVYGDGAVATDDSTQATAGAGQGVVVVTQGRCLARVNGTADITIGDKLTRSAALGVLELATTDDDVIAIALQPLTDDSDSIIAVDVQRGGLAA